MNPLKWIKSLIIFNDLVKKIESHEERIRELEIQNSSTKTALEIVMNGLEIKYKRGKK